MIWFRALKLFKLVVGRNSMENTNMTSNSSHTDASRNSDSDPDGTGQKCLACNLCNSDVSASILCGLAIVVVMRDYSFDWCGGRREPTADLKSVPRHGSSKRSDVMFEAMD